MSLLLKSLLHKKWLIGSVILLGIGGGITYKKLHPPAQPLRYVLAAATRGTLIVSVNGSGQVSGQNQLEVKPNVSGAITKILVKPNQEVKAGTPLVEIDKKTALRAIRDANQSLQDARVSLNSAQLSLRKLKEPADTVALLQAQNAVNQATRDLHDLEAGPDPLDIRTAEAELATQLQNTLLSDDNRTPRVVRTAYNDTVPILKTTAQTLQQALYNADAVIGIDNIVSNDSYEKTLSVTDSSKLTRAQLTYPAVKQLVNAFKRQTDALQTSEEDPQKINTALKDGQQAINAMDPFLQTVYEAVLNSVPSPTVTQSTLDSLRSSIQSDRSSVASKLTSLTSQEQAIENAQKTYDTALLNVEKSRIALEKLKKGAEAKDIANAKERLQEAQASLDKLKKGTDPIDLASSENTISQRRVALTNAQSKLADTQEALNDYTIRAPFDGIVAKISLHEGDQASPSTALLTLLTEAKIAQISLNEVDVSKVKVGQKTTLTFDAVPDLSIAGSVSEVDTIGTVTQGVVNYSVKIIFITQDERIKPGMSVSASIITELKNDVVLVPNAAIRRIGNTASVQTLSSIPPSDITDIAQGIPSATPPETHPIEIGIANDQSTEVVSGLKEGDQIVTRTIDPNATTATRTTQSTGAAGGLRIPGLGGGGGNAGGATFIRR